jgi:hypothetical protein
MANLRANKITSTEVFETTGSVQFDGSGDYLSLANSGNDFKFGTADFTIEMWINPNTVNTSSQTDGLANIVDFDATVGFGSNAWFAIHQGNSTIVLAYSGANRIASTSFLTSNTWFHIAVVRYNGTFTIYANGVSVGSLTETKDFSDALSRSLFIGKQILSSNERNFNGHISNLRILKGQALYTENFTPPTRELEVIPNTVLLACQSKTQANQEATGKTITVNGNAVANELTPGLLTNIVKSGGSSAITGSVEFDGTGDYLSIPSSTDFDFGSTTDFTIECWIYQQNRNSTYYTILFQTDGSNLGGFGLVISPGSGGILQIFRGGFVVSSTSSVSTNGWVHIAASRKSGTTRLFINGILDGTSNTSYTPTFNDVRIGMNPSASYENFQGFISNLRIIKGRALYTSNFIPPTRKLTRLPGTVLLCCQDTKNPTQEATGKTITPYGSLDRQNVGVELVTNGTFDNGTTGWVANGTGYHTFSVVSGALQVARGNFGLGGGEPYQNITLEANKTYVIQYQVTSGDITVVVYDGTIGGTTLFAVSQNLTGTYKFQFINTGSTGIKQLHFIPNNSLSTASIDNVSVTKLDPGPKPPFVPQIGSDGSVVFDGTTKINTPNYFYLPTGPTEQRSRGRGVFGGGFTTGNVNTIDYININSVGNSLDFGDLTQARHGSASCSSSTRGVFGGGASPTFVNTIDYITISSTSNALDFGDLTQTSHTSIACSSTTRGVFGGGLTPTVLNTLVYITIASTGNAVNFGSLTQSRYGLAACSSSTRGVFGGGAASEVNIIDYVTIASTGNATDFGDLTQVRAFLSACSSSTRGVFGGGATPTIVNTIDFITISTLGNAVNFGSLTQSKRGLAACSSSTRGVFGGGENSSNFNIIDYVTISSTGNAVDFGDLFETRTQPTSCSDSHGGLG